MSAAGLSVIRLQHRPRLGASCRPSMVGAHYRVGPFPACLKDPLLHFHATRGVELLVGRLA